jgi:2,3-bisphosphoglycerate-dependent phosphoglycerate mutase
MTDRYAILLRHGAYHQKPDTPSALQPFPLTEAGMAQARDAGRALAGLVGEHGWRVAPEIFCSRQQRAWQTATLLARSLAEVTGLQMTITEDEALAERSVGAFANLSLGEIEEVLGQDPRHAAPPDDWKANSHYRLPVQGAESLMEAGERVARFLTASIDALAGDGTADAQVFVGHGAAFRHAAHHLGVLAFDDIRKLSMHHATPVVLKVAADGSWSHFIGAWKERPAKDIALD